MDFICCYNCLCMMKLDGPTTSGTQVNKLHDFVSITVVTECAGWYGVYTAAW